MKTNIKLLKKPNRSSLDLCFPIHRTISCSQAKKYLYEGMLLELRVLPNNSIAVVAHGQKINEIIGLIPKGMLPHFEYRMKEVLEACTQVYRLECERLEEAIWIKMDSIPSITELVA